MGVANPDFVSRRRRRRAQLRRAAACRAARRRRASAAHRTIPQRAGVARSAPVPAAAHPGAPAGRGRPRRGAFDAGRTGGRRPHAVVHALPSGAAGAGRPLLSRARRAAAGATSTAWRRLAPTPMRCRSAPARLRGRATPSTSTLWRATSAFPASSPTASTPPPIAISPPRSCTPARSRWCISAGWPRT